MYNPPLVTDETYEVIRARTLMPHETASLFETVSEISATDAEEADELEDEDGQSVNALSSPLALWEFKKGLYKTTAPAVRSLWSRIKWGVMDSVCEEQSLESRRPSGTYIDGHTGLLSARPDFEVTDDGINWYPMVAKNIANTMVDMWKNSVGDYTPPEHMIVEANHHMAVTGAQRFYIVALFGGVTAHHFVVPRDEELVEEIYAASVDFWECVNSDRRPKASSDRDAKVLSRLFALIDPAAPVADKRNDADFIAAQEEKERISKQMSILKKRSSELGAFMAQQMEGFSAAIISDTQQIRWVRQEAGEVSYQRRASAHLRTSRINSKAAGTPISELASQQ